MNPEDILAQEIEEVEQRVIKGIMPQIEANKAITALVREYRETAEEAAQNAYRRELDNW